MKIISWNVNGLRAVEKKGALGAFLEVHQPDVLFVQETKLQPEQASPIVACYTDYVQAYHSAEKKGYSSVSAWVRSSYVATITTGMPNWNDTEGRVIRADVGEWALLGVYFPNGGKSPEAWEEKLRFYDCFLAYVNDLRASGKKVAWGGDVNCAHHPIDLARPKDNEGKIGFHPKERAWLDQCAADGWVDVYRAKNPDGVVYSWWHMLTRARARNVGWRIDYWFVHQDEMPHVAAVTYLTEQMGSDHCPVVLELH